VIEAAYDRPMSTADANGEPRGPNADEGTLPVGLPSRGAYLLAFGSVLFAGVFGAIIGYGLVNVSNEDASASSKLFGSLIGSIVAAGGVGIVAVLVLRAMSEWKRRPPGPPAPRRPS
jgi:hypothetical protein